MSLSPSKTATDCPCPTILLTQFFSRARNAPAREGRGPVQSLDRAAGRPDGEVERAHPQNEKWIAHSSQSTQPKEEQA